MNQKIITAFGLVVFASLVQAQAINDDYIATSYAKAAKFLKVDGSFQIIPGRGSTSNSTSGAVIDPVQLQQATSMLSDSSKFTVADFIIAHEVWHQKQFELYGKEIFSGNASDSRLYECQADLAGSYYALSNRGISKKQDFEILKSIVDTAVREGTFVHQGSSHPNSEQRRSAVKYGFSIALLNSGVLSGLQQALEEVHPGLKPTRESMSVDDLNFLGRKILDYPEGTSIGEWSLKICKQITHYSTQAISNIAAGTARIEWNKSSDNPIVKYFIPYRNLSQRPIRLNVFIQTVLIPRSAPADTGAQVVFATDPRTLNISPGATAYVNGTLPWFGDNTLFPRLEYQPNSTHSMISAEFTGSEADVSTCLGHSPPTPTDLSKEMSRSLVKLAGGAEKKFQEFQSGAGSFFSDFITYESSVKVPGSLTTDIERMKSGASSVSASLYAGTSKTDALNIFSKYKEALLSLCPPIGIDINQKVVKELPRISIPYSAKTEARLGVYKFDSDEKYRVTLELDAINW